jgi:hypothetical protein
LLFDPDTAPFAEPFLRQAEASARTLGIDLFAARIADEPVPARETTMQGSAVFNGVFELREGVSEEVFLPTLKAFYEHFIEMGFASGYRILRREALEGFGRTLPPTYRGALIYSDLESEHAAYAYVQKNGEPVRSLHRAMNSKVKRSADFFVETCIVCHRSSSG